MSLRQSNVQPHASLRHCAPDAAPTDRVFDRFLPEPLRLVSPEYWTPLAVAKRAAEWLDDLGIRTVVDIGSGAGKFCVAGALFGKCRFVRLEQHSSLVAFVRALADLFDLNDRVSFVAGALGRVPAPIGDTYYLFNPFGDYWLGADHPSEAGAEFTDFDTQTTSLRRKICCGAYHR